MKKSLLTLVIVFAIACSSYAQKNMTFDTEQGAKAAEQVAAQMSVDTVSAPAKYIMAVGDKLVENLDNRMFEYKFHMVDMFEPNAFALPGGYVYVTRGILMLLNNEDQLAGIIGHEIIHAHNRHSYNAAKKSILPTVLKAPGNVIGLVNEDLGKLINAPLELTSGLRLASYGRKQETEADNYGIQLSAKSGYNPMALATALEQLVLDVEYLTGKEEKFNYFNDHPYTPDRIENITLQSSNLKTTESAPIAGTQREFLNNLEGIYIGEHPAQGVFEDNHFYHADLNLDITFPEGWKLTNESTHVAAQQEDKKAQVYMIIVPVNAEPKDVADAFIEKFRKKYRVESYRAEEFDANGYPAYVFGVDEMANRTVNNSTIIWIKKDGLIYQIVGAGEKAYEKDFESVAKSIGGLTKETREKVTGIALRIASAKDGETLSEFSERSGNVLKTDFLAIINEVTEETKLTEGQLLKIGIREQYIPGK
jgi:predicted Zn-dependent protease